MKCIKCGSALSDVNYCMTCGTDVTLYKKIIKVSNSYYNKGLEKAKVRDLSGAVVSLKQSLRFYKNNTNARNLLGLIYYEMGDVVSALSEWVVSKNLNSIKNIADEYIDAIQSNQNKLETINQTIKKYNQALLYCRQGSEDLAIIQLKKVLSLNSNLINGHQLLALLYMKTEEYDKAEKALNKALKIDTTNTISLRYMKELSTLKKGNLSPEAVKKQKEKNNRISYKSGNETIIQPTAIFKENTGLSTVINIMIGLVVGAALIWFLVVPAKSQAITNAANESIRQNSEELASKMAKLEELEQTVTKATEETNAAKEELESYTGEGGIIASYENLLRASSAYIAGDDVLAAQSLSEVDGTTLTGDNKTLYDAISADVNAKAASSLYSTGYSAYKSGEYETAIEQLKEAYELDPTNGNALYYLGRSYQRAGDIENANATFDMVIEQFPNTEKAANAASNKQ